jgi:carboxyl-terminal processing protease
MDAHRVQLEQLYPTFEEFSTNFVLSDDALQLFVTKATAKGVEFDKDGFERSKGLIRDQLTAMIAQRLFSTSEFYRVMNPRQSEYYKKALDVLSRRSADGTIGSMLKN